LVNIIKQSQTCREAGTENYGPFAEAAELLFLEGNSVFFGGGGSSTLIACFAVDGDVINRQRQFDTMAQDHRFRVYNLDQLLKMIRSTSFYKKIERLSVSFLLIIVIEK